MRRFAPPHLLLVAYCAGLCLALAVRPSWPVLAAGVATAAATVVAALAAGRARAPGAPSRGACLVLLAGLASVFLIGGVAVGGARLCRLEDSTLAAYVGREADVTATLTDLPALKNGKVTLALQVSRLGRVPMDEPAHLRLQLPEGQVFRPDPEGDLVEGAIVRIAGAGVESLPEAHPGEFDYGLYLRRRGEHVLLEAEAADLRLIGRRGGLQGIVDRLRDAAREHLRAGVRPPVSDVLQGMVLGDDEYVAATVVEDFRRSGLLHIMAVSGENVVLLCGMWSFALALLAVPRLARTVALLPVVAVYVLLTGASPSIVRAGVAGIVGLLAVLASRPSDGWLLWLVPAAWLLTVNPNALFDASFQLSFGAVAGLLVMARRFTTVLRFLPGPLPEQVGVTAAASLSTAPISMLTFGSTSLVSIPANVAGGFVLGPIMFLGMLSLLLGFIGPWASAPLNIVAGLFIGFLLDVSHFFARLPWAVYEWRGLDAPLLLTGALAVEAVFVWLLARRAGGGLRAYLGDRRRRAPLLAVTLALTVAAVVAAPPAPAAPQRPTLTVLDVGEGAAALLQAPGSRTVLIDAGPAPLARTLREHAVEHVGLLVLSHGHADHCAGLADVLGSVPIDVALLPQPPAPSASLDRLAARLTAAGTTVRRCTTPLELSGPGWRLRVLPTAAVGGGGDNQSENDAALVVLAELSGQRVLLPGDAEGDVLERLGLPACAVVELPHHGSRGGLDAGEMAALRPGLAVISVGPNRYGHPTAEMLELCRAAGVPLVRTDQRGDVALWVSGGRLRVAVAKP